MPTICLLRGHGGAGTQNDRLGDAALEPCVHMKQALACGNMYRARDRPCVRTHGRISDAEVASQVAVSPGLWFPSLRVAVKYAFCSHCSSVATAAQCLSPWHHGTVSPCHHVTTNVVDEHGSAVCRPQGATGTTALAKLSSRQPQRSETKVARVSQGANWRGQAPRCRAC